MTDLAPIDYGEDGNPDAAEAIAAPAPVFPTEADIEVIEAELTERGAFDGATERQRTRLVQQRVAELADARALRRHSRQRVAELAEVVTAPVFPTEEHVATLHASVPNLTDDELRNVLSAGHAAWLASCSTGEAVTDVPEPEQAQ